MVLQNGGRYWKGRFKPFYLKFYDLWMFVGKPCNHLLLICYSFLSSHGFSKWQKNCQQNKRANLDAWSPQPLVAVTLGCLEREGNTCSLEGGPKEREWNRKEGEWQPLWNFICMTWQLCNLCKLFHCFDHHPHAWGVSLSFMFQTYVFYLMHLEHKVLSIF